MEKIFEMTLIQEHDIEMGETCKGYTLIVPTDGGKFTGRINGTVVPLGMGIVNSVGSGKNDIDTTMLLETDDGANILMTMKGIFDVDEKTEAKLEAGEYVAPSEYYHKGYVSFQTDAEAYKWLERKVCVSETEIKSWEALLTRVYMF